MSEIVEREVSLKDIFNVIKYWVVFSFRKWPVFVVVGIIGGGLGYWRAINQKTIYTATLRFALEEDKSSGGLTGALSLASQFGLDVGGSAGGAFGGANLFELMHSRNIVEKTLLSPMHGTNGKSFADYFLDFKGWRKGWEKKVSLKNLHFPVGKNRNSYTLQQDSILGLIYKSLTKTDLTISPRDKKISIFDITLKSENEFFAKYFVEAIAKEVSNFYITTKTKKASTNLSILQKQTDSVKAELYGAIEGVATASDNTFNLNTALNVKRVPSQKRQIDIQANTAVLTELVKNLEIAKLSLRKETPLIQIIDTPIFPLDKSGTSKLLATIIGSIISGLMLLLFFIFRETFKKQDESFK